MKPKFSKFDALHWANHAILRGEGARLSRGFVEQFEVSRATAAKTLRGFVASGWLESTGGTKPVFRLGGNRIAVKSYPLPGVDEHIAWEHDFRPVFELPQNVANIAHHGFTEMVNNANDHSEGKLVSVLMRVKDGRLSIVVTDNGIGIFEKICRAMALPDRRLAMQATILERESSSPRGCSISFKSMRTICTMTTMSAIGTIG